MKWGVSRKSYYFVEAASSCAQLTAVLCEYARKINKNGGELTKVMSVEVSAEDIKNWLNVCYRIGICLENLEALVMDLVLMNKEEVTE